MNIKKTVTVTALAAALAAGSVAAPASASDRYPDRNDGKSSSTRVYQRASTENKTIQYNSGDTSASSVFGDSTATGHYNSNETNQTSTNFNYQYSW